MKVNVIDPTDLSNPFVKKVSDLKFDTATSVLTGKFRNAIKAQKELADLALDNFETVAKVPVRTVREAPIFSKFGLRVILFKLINALRCKTPAEKIFREMCKLYKKGIIKI